jgi:hypothetical protein
MTFDTHLINVALASLGIAAGIAVLIAIAITGIAAVQLRGRSSGGGTLAAIPAHTPGAHTSRERERQAA